LRLKTRVDNAELPQNLRAYVIGAENLEVLRKQTNELNMRIKQ